LPRHGFVIFTGELNILSASVFAFPSRGKGPQPWTNDELAELYRVVDLLGRAGLSVATDMGMSDEGDPWFVFCRVDNDEVIAHFARIDGIFVAASIAVDETFRGANFRQIVDRMVSSQPLVMPRPNPGSKLFLHPAVMLTAFVATALAHSEKTHALDWLHAVEAQWGHGKAAILAEVRHIKTGWLDTLQTILKMPLHDYKLAVDSTKETQALTLVSLIAIAMSALQPIVEKISVLAQFVADELPGHSTSTQQASGAHVMQLVQDGTADTAAGMGSDHGANGTGGHASGGASDDTPGPHKIAAPTSAADGVGDTHNATIDAATAHATFTVPTVQKAAWSADDSVHYQAASIEAQPEASGAFMLMQQKIAAMAAAPQIETIVILAESSNTTPSVITTDEVTPQALKALVNGKPESSSSTSENPAGDHASTDSGEPTGASPTNVVSDAGGASSGSISSPTAPTTPQAPVNQVVDDVNTPLTTVIQTISNFVNSTAHASDASFLTGNATLQNELSSYFTGGNSSLKVVFFDSNTSVPDVFLFSTGVVFVEEKDISSSLHLSNGGGTLTLQVDSQGGTVTLVGVATVTEQHTIVSA